MRYSQARQNKTTSLGRNCLYGEEWTDIPNCPDEVITVFDNGGGMFFKAQMRIISNSDIKSRRGREEDVSDIYGGDKILRRACVPMNL